MIPFARIIKYGNKSVAPSVIKVFSTSKQWFALQSNGELYGKGAGAMGDGGNTFRSTWRLISTDVRNFWPDDLGRCIYIQKTDNTVQYAGAVVSYYKGTGAGEVLNFTTDAFLTSKGVILDIKYNVSNPSIGALTKVGGEFYAIGSQRALNVSSTNLNVWTLFGSGKACIATNGLNWFTTNTVDGSIYGGGQNISNIFNGSSESSFISYPQSMAGGSSSTSTRTLYPIRYGLIYVSGDLTAYYGRGSNGYGAMGTGSTGSAGSSTTRIDTYWSDRVNLKRVADFSYCDILCFLYYTSTGLYYSGSSSYVGDGAFSQAGTRTESTRLINTPFDASLIEYVYSGTDCTYVYLSNGKVYASGRIFTSDTNSTISYVYVDMTNEFDFVMNYTNESMKNGNS